MNTTVLLYEKDPYMKSCHSKILTMDVSKNGYIIVLDETIFYPEGGGQPSDQGYIHTKHGKLRIKQVFEEDGIIHHLAEAGGDDFLPEETSTLNELIGDRILCELDWEKRFSNMQRHCGEHILSAVFYEAFGGVNRGFHMSDDYMTIDINLEENPKYDQMTEEMIKKAEWNSNKMIWDNLPVSVRRFENREDAARQPMRKKLTLEEDIVLVCIGNESNPAGCVACCGTHPHTTGEVGVIKIYRWEKYKGMTRITFDAGPNALKRCIQDAEIINKLYQEFSADNKTLLKNIENRENKNKEIRQELYEFKQAYLQEKADIISKDLQRDNSVTIVRYPILKTQDLLNLSKKLAEIPSGILTLVSDKENTLLLLSNGNPDCNKIIKENAPVWRGKGGGKPNSGRVMFPDSESLNCFLAYLENSF